MDIEQYYDVISKLTSELESSKKTIEELKIEDNIFNGVSIELYAKQIEVQNLKYLLRNSYFTIKSITELLNKMADEIKPILDIVE